MNRFPLLAALASLLLSAPLAAEPVDFDRALDLGAVLNAAREASVPMTPVRGVAFSGGIRIVDDSKNITLEPGQNESPYVSMESTAYHEVCENRGPWGPICREQVMFREIRRFKVVVGAAIPSSWGRQTFRVRLEIMGQPVMTIEALDRSHSWEYVLPEMYEDVLTVKPVLSSSPAAFIPVAGRTICTLRRMEGNECVYSCRDGREIRRRAAVSGPGDPPTIACPQILIPF